MQRQLVIAAISALFLVSTVFADSARPERTVLDLVGRLKETSTPITVLEFVDFDEALARMTPSSREPLGITTAKELEEFYRGVYSNSPIPAINRMKDLSAGKRAELEKELAPVIAATAKPQVDPRLSQSIFEIKKTVADDQFATIRLYVTEGGTTNETFVQLIKKNDKWVLPCVQLVPDPLRICQ